MENFDNPPSDDQLKEENDFLKMKLMLEHGAQFSATPPGELPPQLENHFLNTVMAFEEQFKSYKTIKVYDKIGRPTHFKPVANISDNDIGKAWDDLQEYLFKYGLQLSVCSPNISERELYRFTIEELFQQETDDMDLPGWMTNFIYDEFHPDPYYDNTRIATHDCINCILQKDPMEWSYQFREDQLRLNQHHSLTHGEFKKLVNQFKDAYDDLDIVSIDVDKCIVDSDQSAVTGSYKVEATVGTSKVMLAGTWNVQFEHDNDLGGWNVAAVDIKGIEF